MATRRSYLKWSKKIRKIETSSLEPEGATKENTRHKAKRAFLYARDVINGRFPEGEYAISQSKYCSLLYARDIIKGRFHAGEHSIAEDKEASVDYACLVIKGRFPEGESAISECGSCSYEYALLAIKGRFPAGEDAISQGINTAYGYSLLMKEPFLMGETSIKYDTARALDYQFRFNRTMKIIEATYPHPLYTLSYCLREGKRCRRFEPRLIKFPRIWKRYCEFFGIKQQRSIVDSIASWIDAYNHQQVPMGV